MLLFDFEKLNQLSLPLLNMYVQGDHGGQRLCFVDLIFKVPPSCPTIMPISAQF